MWIYMSWYFYILIKNTNEKYITLPLLCIYSIHWQRLSHQKTYNKRITSHSFIKRHFTRSRRRHTTKYTQVTNCKWLGIWKSINVIISPIKYFIFCVMLWKNPINPQHFKPIKVFHTKIFYKWFEWVVGMRWL